MVYVEFKDKFLTVILEFPIEFFTSVLRVLVGEFRLWIQWRCPGKECPTHVLTRKKVVGRPNIFWTSKQNSKFCLDVQKTFCLPSKKSFLMPKPFFGRPECFWVFQEHYQSVCWWTKALDTMQMPWEGMSKTFLGRPKQNWTPKNVFGTFNKYFFGRPKNSFWRPKHFLDVQIVFEFFKSIIRVFVGELRLWIQWRCPRKECPIHFLDVQKQIGRPKTFWTF